VPFELMKFTLTYFGELHAAGNNSPRAKEKWDIRKALHPQLDELWQTHPVLKGFGLAAEGRVRIDSHLRTGHDPSWRRPPEPRVEVEMRMERNARTVNAIRKPINVGGFGFIPLVRHSLSLACDLDIIFMRKEEPGSLILQGGDIDNRLKTLFDGLRALTKDEMKIGSPEHDAFFCLLY
jgi:hypothetical protein